MVESIGVLFLFPRSNFNNKRIATSESNEHTFGNYHIQEIEITMDIFLYMEPINSRKTHATYEINLNTHGYQATYEGFFEAASNCNFANPTSGQIHVNDNLPCVEHLWDTSMRVVIWVHH